MDPDHLLQRPGCYARPRLVDRPRLGHLAAVYGRAAVLAVVHLDGAASYDAARGSGCRRATAPRRPPPSLPRCPRARPRAPSSHHRRLGDADHEIQAKRDGNPTSHYAALASIRPDGHSARCRARQDLAWGRPCQSRGLMPTRRTPSSRNPSSPCRGTCPPVLPLHPPRRPCYGWTRARARQGRTTTGL